MTNCPRRLRIYVRGEVAAEGEAFLGQDLMTGPADECATGCCPILGARSRGLRLGHVVAHRACRHATAPARRLHWIAAVNRHMLAIVPRVAIACSSVPVVLDLLLQAERNGYDHELERYVSVPELRLVFQALARQRLCLDVGPMLEAMLAAVIADLAGGVWHPRN